MVFYSTSAFEEHSVKVEIVLKLWLVVVICSISSVVGRVSF